MNDARTSSRRHAWAWSALAIGLTLSVPEGTWAHEASSKTFNEGWRQAKVISLIDSAEPTVSTHIHHDCRNRASTAEGFPYVLASYSFGGNPNLRRQIVVPVQAASTIKVGDAVHAHISDCRAMAH
jgi:hypothetical protein